MRVRVRLFAGLRDVVGQRELTIHLAEGATISDLRSRLEQLYPQLTSFLPALAYAVDEEFRSLDYALGEGDEVALIPPISGGEQIFDMTYDALDAGPLLEAVRTDEDGAIVLFYGVVRGQNEGRKVITLEYDAYPSMAAKAMRQIGDEIASRWPGAKAAMRHRLGRLSVGETSILIAVAAPHRQEAFEACRYAIDRVKEVVPIWKKETWEGGEAWLEGHPVREEQGED
jgi:molybdopterin converting factor subunit 1